MSLIVRHLNLAICKFTLRLIVALLKELEQPLSLLMKPTKQTKAIHESTQKLIATLLNELKQPQVYSQSLLNELEQPTSLLIG